MTKTLLIEMTFGKSCLSFGVLKNCQSFPRWHGSQSEGQWGIFLTFSSLKWGKASLFFFSNPFQHALFYYAFRDENIGTEFRLRADGGFYKLQMLRTQRKVMLDILRDLLWCADDCAHCASTEGDMQWMVDLFAEACANFGLTISIKKMEVMFQPAPGEPYVKPVITINNLKLKVTEKLSYLDSVMSDSATIDDEI